MSGRFDTDQAWAFVEAAHTGILTTLRRDGRPVPLPVWFVVLERAIHLSTPVRTRKLTRIARDPRAAFLVESGQAWSELQAVMLPVRAAIVDDDVLAERVAAAIDVKYAAHRTPRAKMDPRMRARYEAGMATIRLELDGEILSWDNTALLLDD